ncbi:hypothetical protein QW180_26535 [Vibrio sinaloensis]|nr:hypothetical protein [Vibrio sinaloensis]
MATDYRLRFWGFYFVGLIPVRAVQNINDNIPFGFALLFTEIVLEILVIMGIWNLRSKYEGAKAWIWISLVFGCFKLVSRDTSAWLYGGLLSNGLTRRLRQIPNAWRFAF